MLLEPFQNYMHQCHTNKNTSHHKHDPQNLSEYNEDEHPHLATQAQEREGGLESQVFSCIYVQLIKLLLTQPKRLFKRSPEIYSTNLILYYLVCMVDLHANTVATSLFL